jgi:DNA-binding winged helix-turn-helix (wHTH) protein/tetratricopeptide (TPR) repeat protein
MALWKCLKSLQSKTKMSNRQPIAFDVFTLDTADESLWRGSERIHLRPKTFAFLQYLASHPDQMITKEQLLNTLWKNCYVSDGALKNCVTEIRKALGDPAEAPRFIATAHRRGYRFIAEIGRTFVVDGTHQLPQSPQPILYDLGYPLVGRERELSVLRQLLENALGGARQIAFVTGEQGIGKTALVDAFVKSVSSESNEVLMARGQCVQIHGQGEAYMPFCEAIIGLCQMHRRNRILAILRQCAPIWLSQMPSLTKATQARNFGRTAIIATHERTLREMAEAVERLAIEMPLILVLEDLHWSDYSTLNLISYLAQRRAPTRLFLLATYRPTETLADDHPLKTLKNDLKAHKQCYELPLAYLTEEAVGEYLMQRFVENDLPAETATWIHQRTEGHPLFMVNLLDHLVARGVIVRRERSWTLSLSLDRARLEVPQTIQEILERQIDRCTNHERRLIEAASVAGMEFSISGISAVLGEKASQIERRCRELAQRRLFIEPAGSPHWAAGSRESCYKFSHVVYQSILYQRLPDELRADLHRRVAEYIERTNKKRLADVAARLAMHFEQGRKYRRAIQYYQQAASNANWRYAGREAVELAERGMQLLKATSSFPEKPNMEMSLQVTLGNGLLVARGFDATEKVKHAFHRATELFQQLCKERRSRRSSLQFYVLWDLWYYNWRRAEYAAAHELADQMLQRAEAGQDSIVLAQAHYAAGRIMMNYGKFSGALKHLEQCPTVVSRIYAALAMGNLGYPDRAMKYAEETIAQALEEQNPEGCILAYMGAARIHVARREEEKAFYRAQAALDISRQHSLTELWLNPTKIMLGWALAKRGKADEGIEQVRQALAAEYRELGVTHITSFLLTMFAEVLGDAGKTEEGLTAIREALDASRSTGVNHHDAEIYRLKGELLLQRIGKDRTRGKANPKLTEVESCFEQAIAIARRQQAKLFELRATTSLARLLMMRSREAEARERLTRIYRWFSEGHDTPDLQDARAMLQQLS